MGKIKALAIELEELLLEEERLDRLREQKQEETLARWEAQEEFDFERDCGERQKL